MLKSDSREELENELYSVFKEVNANDKTVSNINDILLNKNIYNGIGIISTSIPLEGLEIDDLCLVTNAVYLVTKNEKINPSKFFTEVEIKDFTKSREGFVTKTFPLIFENVRKISDNQYDLLLTNHEFADLDNSGLIFYNPSTQRNKTLKKRGDRLIEKIAVNEKNVTEIYELMAKEEFVTNHITLNLLKDGKDNFYFDEKNNKLVITEGEIDNIDGFHRGKSMKKLDKNNPNITYITGVYITNFTEDEANRFIKQENSGTKIDLKYLETKDTTKLINQIIKRINTETTSDMRGKITYDNNLILNNIAYVIWDTLYKAIEKTFKVRTQKDVNSVSDYLIKGFNKLISTFEDDFVNDLESSKEKYITAYNNTFIGYVVILSELYQKEDWEILFELILKSIDFDIKLSIWTELKITKRSDLISEAAFVGIINYFRAEVTRNV